MSSALTRWLEWYELGDALCPLPKGLLEETRAALAPQEPVAYLCVSKTGRTTAYAKGAISSEDTAEMHDSGWTITPLGPLTATPSAEQERLWLWRNFVDGEPQYWAFDNAYPCFPNGDPMTLGEPCGYALVKQSTKGRDVPDEQVIAAIKRALSPNAKGTT